MNLQPQRLPSQRKRFTLLPLIVIALAAIVVYGELGGCAFNGPDYEVVVKSKKE